MQYISEYLSPIGRIFITADDEGLTGLCFEGQKGVEHKSSMRSYVAANDNALIAEATRWLDIYFSGQEPGFTPPIHIDGTPFRLHVWRILEQIPYGQTLTYGEVAERVRKQLGRSAMSAQAVGGAIGHNPIALIVPCHRVIGAGGSLTGYAAGIERKRFLLELEQRGINTSCALFYSNK